MHVTLPMYCPECAAPINVELDGWNYGSRLHQAELTCPTCDKASVMTFPGKVVKITKRSDPTHRTKL